MKKMFSILMITIFMLVSSVLVAKTVTVDVVCNGGSVATVIKVWYTPNETFESYGGFSLLIPDDSDVTQINIIVPPGYIFVDSTRDGDVYTFILAIAPEE